MDGTTRITNVVVYWDNQRITITSSLLNKYHAYLFPSGEEKEKEKVQEGSN